MNVLEYTPFDLVETPNPAEVAVAVVVPTLDLREEDLPALGSVYADFGKAQKDTVAQEYLRYVCSGTFKPGEGLMGYYFAKPKTAEEALTPWRTWRRFGNHYWHPVLRELVPVPDKTRPLVTNGAGEGEIILSVRHTLRRVLDPAVSEGSTFVVQEYLSPTPLPVKRYRTPQPSSVFYDWGDISVDIPECLHETIEIGSQQTAFASVTGGVSTAVGGALEGQRYERTNFTRRRPYVQVFDQEFVNGVWRGQKVRVMPPRGRRRPDVI